MPKRIYMGSHLEVDVFLPDGSTLHAVRGQGVEVPQEFVAELDVSGNWTKSKSADNAPVDGEKE